jgi:hypothetical protein
MMYFTIWENEMNRSTVAGLSMLVVAFAATFACIVGDLEAQAPKSVQAEAPLEIIALTISDIPMGGSATVSPEALVIAEDKKLWLNKHQPVGSEVGITVYRLKDGTYEVELKDEKLKWLKVPITDEFRKALIPVSVLHMPQPPKK